MDAARALFSLLFEGLESFCVDRQPCIFGQEEDFFEREAIGVFELEGIVSVDDFLMMLGFFNDDIQDIATAAQSADKGLFFAG